MVAGELTHDVPANVPERRFPPITELAVASMMLVVIGGIYIASYVPRAVPLGPAVGLLVAAGAVLVANVIVLSRVRGFAWDRFFQVFGWSLIGYAVIAGMIGYVFLDDGTRGGVLAVLIAMLLVYAVDIPLLLGFSVARYDEVETPGHG
jgi:uncharacterized membrane protein